MFLWLQPKIKKPQQKHVKLHLSEGIRVDKSEPIERLLCTHAGLRSVMQGISKMEWGTYFPYKQCCEWLSPWICGGIYYQ